MPTIHVEPADEHRRGFARWCLAQTPRIETASATGSDVPLDLFKDIPGELLDGALVDGQPFSHVPDDEPEQQAPKAPAKKTTQPSRRRTTRKGTGQ